MTFHFILTINVEFNITKYPDYLEIDLESGFSNLKSSYSDLSLNDEQKNISFDYESGENYITLKLQKNKNIEINF